MKTLLEFSIKPRLFALLALGFVVATIIGTVSHELGHYLPAKFYGFEPTLHYDRVSYKGDAQGNEMRQFYNDHKNKIRSEADSPEKTKFNTWKDESYQKHFIITLGGPLQTMLTGTIGFVLLWRNTRKLKNVMSAAGWIFVLLCFFWSRQFFNMLTWTGNYILTGKISTRGDESRLSKYLFSLNCESSVLGVGSINFGTGIIGAALLFYTVFYIIPKQDRFTFICAGLAGSAIGWIVWMKTLGPVALS